VKKFGNTHVVDRLQDGREATAAGLCKQVALALWRPQLWRQFNPHQTFQM